jgi:hypothetical protein
MKSGVNIGKPWLIMGSTAGGWLGGGGIGGCGWSWLGTNWPSTYIWLMARLSPLLGVLNDSTERCFTRRPSCVLIALRPPAVPQTHRAAAADKGLGFADVELSCIFFFWIFRFLGRQRAVLPGGNRRERRSNHDPARATGRYNGTTGFAWNL